MDAKAAWSDDPKDAVLENGTYGGRRQSRWLRTADGFAVSKLSFFVLTITSQKIDLSQMHTRLTSKAGDRPHTAKRRKLPPRLLQSGLLVWCLRESRYALPTRRLLTHFPPGVRQRRAAWVRRDQQWHN